MTLRDAKSCIVIGVAVGLFLGGVLQAIDYRLLLAVMILVPCSWLAWDQHRRWAEAERRQGQDR